VSRTRRGGAVAGVAGVVGELLMTLGALVLLFLVWQLWWTDVESDRAQAATVSSLSREFDAEPVVPEPSAAAPEPSAAAPDPRAAAPELPGEAFAIVRVPRFGADYARPIVEGISTEDLVEGLGHYPGTAGPGEVGNFAIAGHRNTFGKPLTDIHLLRNGDRVVVETVDGWTVYAVTSHLIVRPSQSEVIAPVPGDRTAVPTKRLLTFTACHPRFSAKQRWIVHAELIETRTRAQGAPSLEISAPVPAATGGA